MHINLAFVEVLSTNFTLASEISNKWSNHTGREFLVANRLFYGLVCVWDNRNSFDALLFAWREEPSVITNVVAIKLMRMRILENYKTLLANCESHGGLLKAI